MRFDLAAMVRRARPTLRRSAITLRDIAPPAMLATDLYRAVYAPVVAIWQRAADPIAVEYERALSTLTTDSSADIQARIDEAANEFERLFLTLQAALEDWGIRTEAWQRNAWRQAVLSGTGVDLLALIGPEDARETVETRIRANVALIRDVNAEAQRRITTAVYEGITARMPAREVAANIRQAVDMARDRSKRVASDQLSKMAGSLAEERQRQAGITQVKWRSSHKRHARQHHAARDGKLYYLDTKTPVEGGEAVPPGDWVGQPPYCGCRSQSCLIFD